MINAPMINKATIRIGTQRGLSRTERGIGGVYRDEAATPAADVPLIIGGGPALGNCPGLVPLGVVLPPVLRLGGATRKGV